MFAVEGWDKNSSVYKNRASIPLFIKIGLETECLDGEAKNSIVYKGRDRTPMFRRIRKEFQCL